MLGLKYIGNREEGISLVLYRSYKTVSVTPRRPYRFTPKDNVSEEARHYYQGLSHLGIAILDNPADAGITSDSATRTQKLEVESDIQVDVQAPAKSEAEAPVAAEPKANQPEVTADESQDVDAPVDKSLFAEMSDAELSEYLEMNYNRDQLKSLISDLGVDINVGRKSESTLIGDLVNNHKAELVAHLSK